MRHRLNFVNTIAYGKYNSCEFITNDLAIAWIDLRFNGRSLFGRQMKPILNNISGSVDFGSLNALMGPSGAGKSTLLKCINGRQMSGVDGGSDFYVSGRRRIRSCFIIQDISEHLLYGLTAMQSLIFASKLKNNNKNFDHEINARKLLKDLMIGDIEQTPVERCSGGEQKRLAIALELTAVHKPNLLCIDEPTSGLDSNAAEIVIQCLRDISRKHNIAIVTSIHQPNNDVLKLFDKLYVLAKGGVCVYEGSPLDLRHHLLSAEIVCHENRVPIEVLLKISSNINEDVKLLQSICFKSKTDLRAKCITRGRLSPNGIPQKSPQFSLARMWYLFMRIMISTLRSKWKSMMIQFIFIVSLGFVLTKLYNKHIGEPDGCITFDMHTNDSCVTRHKTVDELKIESYLTQNVKLQFFSITVIYFLALMATTLTFTTEVRVFLNEHTNGWYSTGSYYWAKTIAELPLFLIITFCYSLIVYKSNNQIDEYFRTVSSMGVMTAGVLCVQGLGFIIGIIAIRNDNLAVMLAVGIQLMNMMLSGFFAPINELPEGIRGFAHISFLKQSLEMCLTLIYGFDRCPEGHISSVLYQFNLTDENKFWRNFAILVFQVINFRLIALFLLLIKVNPIIVGFNRRANNKKVKMIDEPIKMITRM